MDRDVSLERDAHRHEDAGTHGHRLSRVEQLGEEDDVEVGGHVEVAPERLQERAEQVPRVEADQGDQQAVERVTHLVSENKEKRKRKNRN